MKVVILLAALVAISYARNLEVERLARLLSAAEGSDLNRKSNNELLLEQLVRSLNKKQTIGGGITCSDIDGAAIEAAFTDSAANLQCVYGYQFNDWISTFRDIKNNPGSRTADFETMMNCLGDVMIPILEKQVTDRGSDLDSVDSSCSVWTGRYEYTNSGHPIKGCDAAISDAQFSKSDLQALTTAATACNLHRDMEALEGVVAAVGHLGGMSGSPPVELCVFNYVKRDARWFRQNEPENVGECSYRFESKRNFNDLLSKMLRRFLGN